MDLVTGTLSIFSTAFPALAPKGNIFSVALVVIFEMNSRKDISMIYNYCNIGKFVGLTPMTLNSQYKHISRWYMVLLLTLFIVIMTIITIIGKPNATMCIHGANMIPENFLSTVWYFSNIIYVIISLLGTYFGCMKWKKLFENINLIEKKLPQEHIDISKVTIFFNVGSVVFHVIYLVVNLVEIALSNFQNQLHIIAYIMLKIEVYFQLFDTFLICSFNHMLRRRYNYLQKLIKLAMKDNNLILRNRNEKILKLRNILSIYQIMHEIVGELNVIFGWKIFFILECSVVTILHGFSLYLAKFKDFDNKLEMPFTILITPFLFTVSIL